VNPLAKGNAKYFDARSPFKKLPSVAEHFPQPFLLGYGAQKCRGLIVKKRNF
jgi:hypothetical protein